MSAKDIRTGFDARWLAAHDAGQTVRVDALKRGDRVINCFGWELTYDRCDGALGDVHYLDRVDGYRACHGGSADVVKVAS